MADAKEKRGTFSGVLMPYSNGGKKGDLPSLCLVDSQEGEMLVDDATASGQLKEYIYERVMISGYLKQKQRKKMLFAERFEPLPDPDDDEPLWMMTIINSPG